MDENCYHLCLFYSNLVHPRIIEKDFKSIYEIDLITRQFEDEKDFRNKRSADIAKCQYALFNYIEGMKRKGVKNEKLNGEVCIVKKGRHIRPIYKSTAKTPLQLINSITDKLRKEYDNSLMVRYIDRFKDFLYSDFTKVRKFQEYNTNIRQYKDKKVLSQFNKKDYDNLLDVINQALEDFYKRSTRSLDDRHLFLYREMSDYLDDQIKAMRKREEEKKQALEKKATPPSDKNKEVIDEGLISFDDLSEIMKKYEEEEKEKLRNDPNHVNAKDIPKLLEEYEGEREKIKQLIEEQRLKEDKDKIIHQSNGNFYLDENGQVAFTRTRDNRDREELPDEEKNEGFSIR